MNNSQEMEVIIKRSVHQKTERGLNCREGKIKEAQTRLDVRSSMTTLLLSNPAAFENGFAV